MKYNYLYYITLLLTVLFSCKNDDKFKVPDNLKVGAIPELKLTSDSIIDYSDLQSINKTFSVDIKGEAKQINIIVKRNNNQPQLYQEIAQWPADINVTFNKLISVLGSELKDEKDIKLNDIFVFTADIILFDGTILKGNPLGNYIGYSPGLSLESSKPLAIKFKVSCPSNLAGTYVTISNGTSTDKDADQNPLKDYISKVTIISIGGGQYSVSDGFAGVYKVWYGRYGYTIETVGIITDECGTLTGSWKDLFGNNVVFTGKVDINGKINGHWENDYGDKVDVIMNRE